MLRVALFVALMHAFSAWGYNTSGPAADDEVAIFVFGWLAELEGLRPNVVAGNDTGKFLSAAQIENHVFSRLQDTGVSLGKVVDAQSDPAKDYGWIHVSVDLLKYSESSSIHFGFIDVQVRPSYDLESDNPHYGNWQYTTAVANSDKLIENDIKRELDAIIGRFVADYRRLSDLVD